MARKRFHDKKGRGMGDDMYGNRYERERMDASDYSMISEDHTKISNLPTEVMYKEWPKVRFYADFDLPNDIAGIDEQINSDGSGMKRHKSTKKY